MTECDVEGVPGGAIALAVPQTRSPRAGVARAVLADDAQLMHLAVRALFAATPACTLEAAAATVPEAEQLVRRLRPDLLICEVDIAGESGIRLCRWARQVSPQTSVVIFSGRDEPLLAQAALDAGARGYLLKTSPTGWLRVQIAAAATGRLVVDERLGLTRQPPSGFDLRDLFGLSRREREVLDEIVLGLDNQAIAGRLWIAEATVKSHVKSIRRKLGARDRAHAVAIALGTGAVHLPAPRKDLVR